MWCALVSAVASLPVRSEIVSDACAECRNPCVRFHSVNCRVELCSTFSQTMSEQAGSVVEFLVAGGELDVQLDL